MAEHHRADPSGTNSARDPLSQGPFHISLACRSSVQACPGHPNFTPSSPFAAGTLSSQIVDDGASQHVEEIAFNPSIHPQTCAPANFAMASPGPECQHVPIRPTVGRAASMFCMLAMRPLFASPTPGCLA